MKNEYKVEVTIIIPVYNGEQYVEAAMNSVQRQTFKDIEILFVDNKSTDNTYARLVDLCKKSHNAMVLQQTKRGVSAARNLGLHHARGKYVVFFDVDDIQHPSMIQHLYNLICGTVHPANCVGCYEWDMAFCGYQTFERNKLVEDSRIYKDTGLSVQEEKILPLTSEECIATLFHSPHYQGYVWNKIFRMDIIREHNIKFDEDIHYNEDRLFILKYLMCSNWVLGTVEPLYYYIHHESSAMRIFEETVLLEEHLSELEAFRRMLIILDAYPDVWRCAADEMSLREMFLFDKVLKNKKHSVYRNSGLRKFAKQYRDHAIKIHDYNMWIHKIKYIIYGYTGIVL